MAPDKPKQVTIDCVANVIDEEVEGEEVFWVFWKVGN
jgi:hypothetical protein